MEGESGTGSPATRIARDPTHAQAGGSRRAPRSDRRNDGWTASAMEYRLRAAGVRQRAMAHRVSSLTSVLRHARVWLSPQCSGIHQIREDLCLTWPSARSLSEQRRNLSEVRDRWRVGHFSRALQILRLPRGDSREAVHTVYLSLGAVGVGVYFRSARDCRPSNACHRGSRCDRPQLARNDRAERTRRVVRWTKGL